MPIKEFPDPKNSTEEGVLALGGDLHPQSLYLAYSQGIFPWPISVDPVDPTPVLAWFCPPHRAVLECENLHIPKSLVRALKRLALRSTIDQAFERVIQNCASQIRPGQEGTWISDDLKAAYVRFHKMGYAHSVEVWRGEELAGGIYGVEVNGVFSAESMFHLIPNASKIALLHLLEHLRKRGLDWIDIQVMTPHMERLGARLIERDAFLKRLARTQALNLRLFPKAEALI